MRKQTLMQHTIKALVLSLGIIVTIGITGFSDPLPKPAGNDSPIITNTSVLLYESINFSDGEKPSFEMFDRGINGYTALKDSKQISGKEILTLIDFSKSSNEKRLWVIDLKTKTVLHHTLVAHGRNSGDEYASKFSNIPNSNQSSLGFYVTGATYIGKHGKSLILHGVEKGINDKAQERAIVMHAADYVSEDFIKKVGRLGRSFGCPAIPTEIHREMISTLANGTCLFIYYPDEAYLQKSILSSL